MKFFRAYHKWMGLLLGIVFLPIALSGIILNHRSWFSGVSIDRHYLSDSYQYKNWNNAAVKGSVTLSPDSVLVYGNIGCWLLTNNGEQQTSWNKGLGKGIDDCKVTALLKDSTGNLVAGTIFGLYQWRNEHWEPLKLPMKQTNITGLTLQGDTLWASTRNELISVVKKESGHEITLHQLPNVPHAQSGESMFRTLWVIHSGEILGLAGQLFVDLIALSFLFLSITGFIVFFWPSLIRRLKRKGAETAAKVKLRRGSLKWHNHVSVYVIIFMLITTITGMFLRPPLLIFLSNKTIKSNTNSNPWHDKVRSIRYNAAHHHFILTTSDNFYALSTDLKSIMKIPNQPPVSVMGITVFEPMDEESYLIGSFSGLYYWNPFKGEVQDIIGSSMGMLPSSVSGFVNINDAAWLFDYGAGAVQLSGTTPFPAMSEELLNNSPLSLWNFALEIHTGRIMQDAMGLGYILLIPLTGLLTVILLLSGFWVWWRHHRKGGFKLRFHFNIRRVE
jgi:hypothetical protein